MRNILFFIVMLPLMLSGQTISVTYSLGDIPTSRDNFQTTCNGPGTTIGIILPVGGPWQVTGVDIAYDMTAQNGGKMSEQRSQVHCENTSTTEATIYAGSGNAEGTLNYLRSNVGIANATFSGNTIILFEMRAWRTANGNNCSTTQNKVDNLTWTITLHYTTVPSTAHVGIGTQTPDPSALLELNSNQKGFLMPRMTSVLRDAITAPAEGLMIYCTDCAPIGFYYYKDNIWQRVSNHTFTDADGDTYFTLEQNPDEDFIRLTTAGTERITIANNGKVGIGATTPQYLLDIRGGGDRIMSIENIATSPETSYGIHVEQGGNASGTKYGMYNLISNSGFSEHYGILNEMTGSGSGLHVGTTNSLIGQGSGSQVGNYNTISNTSNSPHYGVSNFLEGAGFGSHYGTYNELGGAGQGTQLGTFNAITNEGNSEHIGSRNDLSGSGSGNQVGTSNLLYGSGSGICQGTHNGITSSGNASHFGVSNILSGNGSGLHYGVYNELGGSGTGTQYGTYNLIFNTNNNDQFGIKNELTGSGYGIKFGIYSTVATANGLAYAGYFDGDVTVIGTFNNPCDEKLKTDVSPLLSGTSLEKLKEVNVYQYHFNQSQYPFLALPKTLQTGVLAQEMQLVFPELVKTNIHPAFVPDSEHDDRQATPEVEYLGVNYIGLIPHLVSAVKDLAALNSALILRLDGQQEIISSLQHQLSGYRSTIESLQVRQDLMALQIETFIKLIEKK